MGLVFHIFFIAAAAKAAEAAKKKAEEDKKAAQLAASRTPAEVEKMMVSFLKDRCVPAYPFRLGLDAGDCADRIKAAVTRRMVRDH